MGHWHGEISSNVTFAYCTKGCIDVAVLRTRLTDDSCQEIIEAKPKSISTVGGVSLWLARQHAGCKKKCTRAAALARKKRGWETEHRMHTKAFGPCCWPVPGRTWSHVTRVYIFAAEPVAFFFFLFLPFSVAFSSSWATSWAWNRRGGIIYFFFYNSFRASFSHLNSFVKLALASSQPCFLSRGACRVCALWGESRRERERERERREPKRERERERAWERERTNRTRSWPAKNRIVTVQCGCKSQLSSESLRQLFDGEHPYGGGWRTAGCSQIKKSKKKKSYQCGN